MAHFVGQRVCSARHPPRLGPEHVVTPEPRQIDIFTARVRGAYLDGHAIVGNEADLHGCVDYLDHDSVRAAAVNVPGRVGHEVRMLCDYPARF